MRTKNLATGLAVLAAALYAVNIPLSKLLLGERPGLRFWLAVVIMVAATVLMIKDTISLQHTHSHCHTHTHEHRHGELVHTHEHTHEHTHIHTHSGNEEIHSHKHGEISGHNHAHSF